MMRLLACLTLLLALALSGPIAATGYTIAPADAVAAVGQHVTVVGVVSQVSSDGRSGTTFINFGGRYPNHVFFAVIFADDAHNFRNLGVLQGQTVSVTGIIEMYRGKPQIILHNPGQIEQR